MASTKASRESKAGQNKKKATAQQHATRKIAERDRTGSRPAVPRSAKQISRGRFPGETPLTGEDRPANASGGKRHAGGDTERAAGKNERVPGHARHVSARPSPLRPGRQNRMAGEQR